jgi:two-component system chemotaxis response regulator CheB
MPTDRFPSMQALPTNLRPDGGAQLTGLVCPDCAGTLQIEVLGRKKHLHFMCRIRHAYSLSDLLTTKEDRLEDRLWTAVVAVEEMRALLADLMAHERDLALPATPEAIRARVRTLEERVAALRQLIEQDRPLVLTPMESPDLDQPDA